MNWHAFSLDLQHLARLRDALLAELHSVAVQVRQVTLPANQRVLQTNAVVHLQIVPVAHEHGVLLLLENNDHVTGVQIGVLVALMLEGDLLAVLHAALNIHGDRVLLRHQLVAVAHVAGLIEGLALAAALLAGLLDLLDEAGSKLNTLKNHAASLADRAGVHMIRVVRARAMAVLAELLAVDIEGHFAAVVQILQSDGNRSLHVLISLLSAEASEAEYIGEGIEALLSSLLLSLLHSLFSLHVVHSSFVFVGQAVVGRLNVNELGFALLSLTLVGVVLQTEFPICSLDL